MKRLLWIFLLLAGGLPLFAQTPDCVIAFTFTATGQRSNITGCGNNKTQGVIEWTVAYTNTGFTGPFSLRLESSQDGISWVTFAGTLNTGINPNTVTTHASTNMSGFNSYVSVALNAAAGSGTVTGVLYGCRQPGCAGGGGGGGSVPNPLPVDGPTAAGSPPTTPPVLVAGQDGAPGNIRTLKTDSNGQPIPANASVANQDALSNTQPTPTGAAAGPLMARVIPYEFDGSVLNRQFSCPFSAPIDITAGTDVTIVTGIAMTTIKICQIVFSSGSTSAGYQIVEGTGTTCLTGTASVTGTMPELTVLALDPKSDSGSYNTATPGDDACLHFSTAVTGGGVVVYAQY